MKLCDEISRRLQSWCAGNSDIIIPNYFIGRWEADVFRLTKSGITYEYEIKTTKSDFKNDFKKSANTYSSDESIKGYSIISKNKHETIKNGERCNRFFFVAPTGVLSVSEIPEYAGLIEFDNYFRIAKNAPIIHKKKFELEKYAKLAMLLSFRERYLRRKYYDLRKSKH